MNRGAEKLREALTEHGSKVALAKDVGVEPYQVSHWLGGNRKPDTKQRAFLEDKLGIGWRLWDDEIAEDAAKPNVPDSGPEAA